MSHYVYLALNLFSIAFPLARSFENRLAFYKTFKTLFPAIIISGAFMIAWDVWFTQMGIWAFNPKYIVGIYLLNLPLEEWLFFFSIPYACAFIYECVALFFIPDIFRTWGYRLAWMLVAVLLLLSGTHLHLWYTGAKLGLTAIALALHLLWFKDRYIGRFLVAYLFTIIPFLVVNGFLTWLPVVTYNNSQNLGIRISDVTGWAFLNIPVEDTMYSLLMLLLSISIFEFLRHKPKHQSH
jgi:lycopene cyclase domain-containing protein